MRKARDTKKTKQQLVDELIGLRQRIANLERNLKRKTGRKGLEAGEFRYRDIVEDQTELICRWLPEGIITFVNDVYCRFFGKGRGELIGHSFIPFIPEEDHEKVKYLYH